MNALTIVIPFYNEGRLLTENLHRIMQAGSEIEGVRVDYLLVDDGSTDDTLEHLEGLCREHPEVMLLSLTRNFGKEAAITAGLEHARGDAVLVMDSDLQHPPEMIPSMVNLWRHGVDVVEACKKSRGNEGFIKKGLAGGFYSIFGMLAGRDLRGHSDFKLLDRKVVEAYLALPERSRFFRGLVPWMGFSSAQVYFEVPDRTHGNSAWSGLKLFRLSVDALTGFSSAPLYLINILGAVSVILGLVVGGIALYDKLAGQAVSGFTTVILLILLMGGFIMFGLGLIGVYLGQIFKEVKKRPLFIVDKTRSKTRDDE